MKWLSWWKSWRVCRKLTAARKRASRVLRRSRRLERRLATQVERWKALKIQASFLLEEVEELNKDRDQAVEMLVSENEVLRDVLLPEMTAAQKMAVERWDAEIAIQTRRRVGASPTVEE